MPGLGTHLLSRPRARGRPASRAHLAVGQDSRGLRSTYVVCAPWMYLCRPQLLSPLLLPSISMTTRRHANALNTPPPVPPNRPEAPLLTPASSALIRWMQIWSWFPMRPTRADDVHAGLLAAAPLSSVETTLYGLQNVFHFCQNPGFLLLSSRVCATNRCSVGRGQTCPWSPFPEMSFVLPRAF